MLPPYALKGKAADSSGNLAKIQADYNCITVNWNLFIFTPRELGRDMKAFCFYMKYLWLLTLHTEYKHTLCELYVFFEEPGQTCE